MKKEKSIFLRFDDALTDLQYLSGDRLKFSRLCVTWDTLNRGVGKLTKDELLRLMKYILETRPHNVTYLTRVVARFNVLNKLTVEDVLP